MRIKKYLFRYAMVLVFTIFTSAAFAQKGEVVFKKSGCDYFIVETNMGFALLEWFGGNDPDKEDVIIGDFESYGMKDIYNNTAESKLRVWVEDFWLSRANALEKLYDKCN